MDQGWMFLQMRRWTSWEPIIILAGDGRVLGQYSIFEKLDKCFTRFCEYCDTNLQEKSFVIINPLPPKD